MNRRCRILFSVAATLLVMVLVAPAAGRAEIPVGGRVLGPDRQGLEGVRVGLEPIHADFERVAMRLDGDVGPGAEADAVTDADGYFELLAPSAGAWKVVVPWNGGSGQPAEHVAQQYLLRPLTEATELPPVVLERASTIRIRVHDENGQPTGARLGLSDRRRPRDGWRTRLRLGRTGDDGLAHMARAAGEEARLEVLGPAHPLVVFGGDELDINDGTTLIRLPPGGVAGTLRVTDPRDRPVAGAVAYQGSGILPLGRSGDDGRLRLVVPPPQYDAAGINVLTGDGRRGFLQLSFPDEEPREATVIVEPLRRVRGQVIDLESRQAVAGAVVWVPNGPVTVSGRGGGYELLLFPSSTLMVQAVAPGYGQVFERRSLDDPRSEDGPTLALPPAATLHGSVADAEGRPLAGVDVTVVPADATLATRSIAFRSGQLQLRTTRQGRFRVAGLPPSTPYELRFRKAGFAPHDERIEGLTAFEDRSGLHVVLDAGRSGVGWVVDEGQAPVAGAVVRLEPVKQTDPRMRFAERTRDGESDDVPTARTNAEGRFELTHLAAGRYNLEARAPGFAPATVPGLTVDELMSEADFGTVVLAPGTHIAGTVRDPDGAPISEARIFLADKYQPVMLGKTQPVTSSDSAGRFTVRDLRDGESYVLVVVKSGYGAEELRATAGESDDADVVLRFTGTVSGSVHNEDGEPIAGAYVQARATAQRRQYVFDPSRKPGLTGDDGTFRLEGVTPGTVRISVWAEGYQRYELGALEVPARGERSDLEVVLLRGATIAGTVTRADATPVADAMVTYSPAREGLMQSGYQTAGETDGAGRYQIEGAAPGPAVIGVQLGGRQQVAKNVEIRPGTQTVDLVVESGYEVTVRVTDESGLPLAGAVVTLATASNRGRSQFFSPAAPQMTGPDGTYTLTDVAAGKYILSAAKEGYAETATAEPFEVGRSPVVIDLELERGATVRGRILGLELDDLAKVAIYAFDMRAGSRGAPAAVDFEGRYRIDNLGPGSWHVSAQIERTGRQVADQIMVEDGVSELELDLEFKPGYSVTGEVRTGGKPRGDMQIFASRTEPGMGNAQAVTGSDGHFRLDHLPAGKYRLMVTNLSGGMPATKDFEVPADSHVVIELSSVRISGVVRDETGERAMPDAAIRLERIDVETPNPMSAIAYGGIATTDSEGRFHLESEAGIWRVTATKAGFAPAEAIVDLSTGTRDDVELRLSPTDGVSFDVVTESGRIPSQVQTAVLDASRRPISRGRVPVTEGGTVRLSTVPAGTWELLVQADDSAVARATINAPGHAGAVRLVRAGSLRLKVPALIDSEVRVVSPENIAQVRLTDAAGRPHVMMEGAYLAMETWPMWNGDTVVQRLAPGVWNVTVEHPDGRSWSGEATVTAGVMSEVVLP